jgi:SAM-dependent methyltransferase
MTWKATIMAREARYDNKSYWVQLHKEYSGQLRAVGFPWLSEEFNELKYKSEAASLISVLETVRKQHSGSNHLSILEAGAGTGYWIKFLSAYFKEQGYAVESIALDISESALDNIKLAFPECKVIKLDLKSIDSTSVEATYDIVYSFYCLHHLVNIDDFLNGLHFLARSVKRGGHLLIMDPMLSLSYSPYHAVDFASWDKNGLPRPRHILDDVLQREGFEQVSFVPAVSYLLNGNIEAQSKIMFLLHRRIWISLCHLYRSASLTKMFGHIVFYADAILKKRKKAFSSSLLVHRRK